MEFEYLSYLSLFTYYTFLVVFTFILVFALLYWLTRAWFSFIKLIFNLGFNKKGYVKYDTFQD